MDSFILKFCKNFEPNRIDIFSQNTVFKVGSRFLGKDYTDLEMGLNYYTNF